MIRTNVRLTLAAAVVLSLSLAACKDTKTLQENEQLKAQVADLQRQNGQLGNNLETVTAARDALMKENSALMAEMKAGKKKRPAKHSAKKSSKKKHHRQVAREFGNALMPENAA
jgi:outer membrane murein-binding lipoprotein Lpp